MTVQIDQMIRSRRRTVAIQIRPDGKVIVRAPLRVAEKLVRDFVESKTAWIQRKQAEALKRAVALPARQFQPGERFLFLGAEHGLRLVDGRIPALKYDGEFILTKSAGPRAALLFERWYRAQAARILAERVAYYAARHHFRPGRIRISSARTRWGSCSSKGTLSFTWRLVMAPPEVIDYVVMHELVHLKVQNHSKTFWDSLAALMPDYKRHVGWLKKHGHSLRLDGEN